MADPVPSDGDEWIRGTGIYEVDFAEFLDWNAVSKDAGEVSYDESRQGIVRREDGSADLAASIAATEPLTLHPESARLPLDARY